MPLRHHFQATTRLGRAVTGRMARCIYASLLLLVLLTSTGIRIHTYVLTRRFQAVLAGLATLEIDKTTEEDLQRQVPYLVRTRYERDVKATMETGNVETGVLRNYCASYTNRDSWMHFEVFAWHHTRTAIGKNFRQDGWLFSFADVFGYRYFDFSTCVLVFNGKVSRISYGVADDLIFPLAIGDVVSVASFHSRWGPVHGYADVSAVADENPAFLSSEFEGRFSFLYNPDAPAALRSDLFHVDLSCFWGLFRCEDARQIAPALVRDKEGVEAATLARLKSADPCPDRIISARARFWPDMRVALVSSLGSKNADVSEHGERVTEIQTDFELVKVLRGTFPLEFQFVTTNPGSPNLSHPNPLKENGALLGPKLGDLVLIFYGPQTCRIIPATPSAIDAFENTEPEPRRVEDERVSGLQ